MHEVVELVQACVVYGPPVVVERLTLYDVAPLLAFHVNATCALPAVAASPVGVAGALPPPPPPPPPLPDPPPHPAKKRLKRIMRTLPPNEVLLLFVITQGSPFHDAEIVSFAGSVVNS